MFNQDGLMPAMLNGMRVYVSKPQSHEFTVKRSWYERLFSRPFNPFKSMEKDYSWSNIIEDGKVIKIKDSLYMSESTYKTLSD
jgi:hypothetical protein